MRALFYLLSGFVLTSFLGLGLGGGFGFNIPCEPPRKATQIDLELSLLSQITDLQQEVGLQDPTMTHKLRKALALAEVLIRYDGALNTDLCQSAKSAFLSNPPEEYEVFMANVIDQLDPSWQPFFDSVKVSEDPDCVGTLTLRALLSLGTSQLLTERHAKIAVLGTLLSSYDLNPPNSNFDPYDRLRDHREFFFQMASDYASLIMNGYLTRPGNNGVDYFFYLPSIPDEDLKKPFTLATNGTFGYPLHMLSDAPGLRAARDIMGGNYKFCSDQEILPILLNESEQPVQTTPELAIASMAEIIFSKKPQSPIADMCKLGHYAFSSVNSNPVLRGVEAAFASMAEERSVNSIRSNINACVEQALRPFWAKLLMLPGASEFHQAFTDIFNKSYQLVYNLNIPLAIPSIDCPSAAAGFQLYRQNPLDPTRILAPVATPRDFERLVLDAASAVQSDLSSAISNAETVGAQLTEWIQTSDFLVNVLWAYDPSSQQELDPVNNYQKLSRTPMLNWDSENSIIH